MSIKSFINSAIEFITEKFSSKEFKSELFAHLKNAEDGATEKTEKEEKTEKTEKAEKTEKKNTKRPGAKAKEEKEEEDDDGEGHEGDAPAFKVGDKVVAHYPADEDNEAADLDGKILKLGKDLGGDCVGSYKDCVKVQFGEDVIWFTPDGRKDKQGEESPLIEWLEVSGGKKAKIEKSEKPGKAEKAKKETASDDDEPGFGADEETTKIDTTKKDKGDETKKLIKLNKALLEKLGGKGACAVKGCQHFIDTKKCDVAKLKSCNEQLTAMVAKKEGKK